MLDALILAERIKPSQDAKRRAFRKYKMREGEERFATAVFYSILRNLGIYDRMIERVTGVRNVYLLDETLRNATRLAIELLRERDLSKKQLKLARSVLAGEIRRRSHPYASTFFWEQWDNLAATELKPGSEEEQLMLTYKVSPLYARKVKELLGEETEAFLKYINTPPPLTLRINILKSSREEIERFLKGVKYEWSDVVPTVVKIFSSLDLERFKPFKEGKVIVQEEAAAAASLILDPQPGETVVDLAAAPGGKTEHMAELMKNRGKIYAIDINEKRVERMKELLKRAGVNIVDIIIEDGREAPKTLGEGIADRVMLDAPCTSSGTVQRNPELRWRIREESDIKEFIELQRELLIAGWKLLKEGGKILYATCSIFKEENEDNVEWFLKETEAELIQLEKPYSQGFLKGTRRAWPHRHKTIGFFYALMRKGE